MPASPPITDPTITGVLFGEGEEGDWLGLLELAGDELPPVEAAGVTTPDGISR